MHRLDTGNFESYLKDGQIVLQTNGSKKGMVPFFPIFLDPKNIFERRKTSSEASFLYN